jgi:hypothetical protein
MVFLLRLRPTIAPIAAIRETNKSCKQTNSTDESIPHRSAPQNLVSRTIPHSQIQGSRTISPILKEQREISPNRPCELCTPTAARDMPILIKIDVVKAKIELAKHLSEIVLRPDLETRYL